MMKKIIITISLFLSLSYSPVSPVPEKEDGKKSAPQAPQNVEQPDINKPVPVKKPTGETITLYKEKLKKLGSKDAEGHFQLAQWCQEKGLGLEMKSQLRRTIRLKPNHAQARELLGYVKENNEWVLKEIASWERKNGLVKYYNTWILDGTGNQLKYTPTPDELEEKKKWIKSWVLRTEHYLIRTNTDPDSAFKLGKVMESLYQTFFDVFDETMTLTEPAQMLRINVFKDRRDYSSITLQQLGSVQGDGWFWPTDGVNTFVFGQTNLNLFHEGSHQLVYACMGINPMESPTLWLHEGLGEYFEAGKLENNRIRLGNINLENLTMLKGWLKQNTYIPLPQFLSLGKDQYMADPRTYAQGWGLAHFLMEYRNGQYRPNFLTYLDDSRTTGGRFEDFKKAFNGIDLLNMEREWKDYLLTLR
ncbi:MAG: DUF1570 domain-containing protein [Planctomycetota bacterium]